METRTCSCIRTHVYVNTALLYVFAVGTYAVLSEADDLWDNNETTAVNICYWAWSFGVICLVQIWSQNKILYIILTDCCKGKIQCREPCFKIPYSVCCYFMSVHVFKLKSAMTAMTWWILEWNHIYMQLFNFWLHKNDTSGSHWPTASPE